MRWAGERGHGLAYPGIRILIGAIEQGVRQAFQQIDDLVLGIVDLIGLFVKLHP